MVMGAHAEMDSRPISRRNDWQVGDDTYALISRRSPRSLDVYALLSRCDPIWPDVLCDVGLGVLLLGVSLISNCSAGNAEASVEANATRSAMPYHRHFTLAAPVDMRGF